MADSRVSVLLDFRSRLDGIQQANTAMSGLIKTVGSFATVYQAVNIFKNLATEAATLADKFDDLADRIGGTIEGVQGLDYLARRTGQSVDIFTTAADKLSVKLAEAKAGSEAALLPFQKLGLSIAELENLTVERRLEAIARAMVTAEDKTAAFSYAADILGAKGAPALRKALEELGGGFDTVANKAFSAGQVMSEANGKALADAKKQWEDYGRFLTVWWTNNAFGPIMRFLQETTKQTQTAAEQITTASVERVTNAWTKAAGATSKAELDAILADAQREADRLAAYIQGDAAQYADRRAPDPAADAGAKANARELANLEQLIARIRSGEYDERVKANAENAKTVALAAERAEAEKRVQLAEEAASVWLTGNREKYEKMNAELRDAALSDEVRLSVLQRQRDAIEAAASTATAAATGNAQRERIRIESENERLRITKEIDALEKSIRDTQDATTRRLLERAAEIGGGDAEDLQITPGKQPVNPTANIEPTPEDEQLASFGDVFAQVNADAERTRNVFEGLYDTLTTISDAFSGSIADGITGLIDRTMTWGDALGNIARTLGTSIVQGISKMFANWVTGMLTQWLIEKTIRTQRKAETAAELPANMANAAAVNTASFGSASVLGIAGIVAALAVAAALAKGFRAGGFTGDGADSAVAGVVHGGEYVFSAPAVRSLGVEYLEGLHASARAGEGPDAAPAAASARNLNLAILDGRRSAEDWLRSTDGERRILEIVSGNRAQLFGV